MKTSELIGPALDWAVAKAWQPVYSDAHLVKHATRCGFNPSTDWAQGGPIIEREKISVVYDDAAWRADPDMMDAIIQRQWGETPLIAAMRCYVASKLGDKIEIPEELQ